MKNFKTTTQTYDAGYDEKKYKAEQLLKEYDNFNAEKIPYIILSKWDLFLISKLIKFIFMQMKVRFKF